MTVTFTKAADVADVEPDDVESGEGEETTEDSPAPAGLLAQFRPYLPTRYIAGVLCSGSLALSVRALEWVTAGGRASVRGRLGGILLALYVAGYEETHGQRWVLPVACGAWVVGALLHSPAALAAKAADDEAADDEDQEHDGDDDFDDEDQEEGNFPASHMPPLDAELVARMVREVAADHGWLGVHLDDLLARLHGRSREDLLACLAGAGIAVHPGFKLTLPGGVQRNRKGVRLDALPAGLGEAPPAPAPAAAPGLHVLPSQVPAAGPADPSPPPAPDPLQKAG